MKQDFLGQIFGSTERPKVIRLFVFNPNTAFELADVISRSEISQKKAKSEIRDLANIGFIKKKVFLKEIIQKKGRKTITKRKKVSGFILNPNFTFLPELKDFIIKTNPISEDYITDKLTKVGRLKLVMVTGVFIQSWDSRLDMLLVADTINNARLEKAVRSLEAQLGMEIRYAAMPTKDFQYRASMNDKLLRDVLDYSHKVVIDKLGISRGVNAF